VPAVISPWRSPPQRVVVPQRVGLALRPEVHRDVIPARVTLAENAPPYAGELREEHTGYLIKEIAVGASATLATLRRAWNFVGWCVNPGDAGVAINAQLRILTRGIDALTAPVLVPVGFPFAVTGIIVGATCELVVTNVSAGPIHGVQGSIWGMGEK
jgi:hypothetical protein